MEVALEVWARDVVHVYEPERAFVAEGTFHYVAVDTDGRPRPVPADARSLVRATEAADSAEGGPSL